MENGDSLRHVRSVCLAAHASVLLCPAAFPTAGHALCARVAHRAAAMLQMLHSRHAGTKKRKPGKVTFAMTKPTCKGLIPNVNASTDTPLDQSFEDMYNKYGPVAAARALSRSPFPAHARAHARAHAHLRTSTRARARAPPQVPARVKGQGSSSIQAHAA